MQTKCVWLFKLGHWETKTSTPISFVIITVCLPNLCWLFNRWEMAGIIRARTYFIGYFPRRVKRLISFQYMASKSSYYSTLHHKWCKTRVTRLDSPNTHHKRSLIVHLEGIWVELESNIRPLFYLVFDLE